MKICKDCGYENPNSANACEKCSNILDDEIIEVTTEDFFKKRERKEKITKQINYLLLIIYYILTILLYFIIAKNEIGAENIGFGILLFFMLFVVFPGMYYLSVFHPDVIFEFSHIADISNISDVQPSDWFYFTTRLSGYIFLGLGIFLCVSYFIIT